ncbi:MAG: SEC-C domain-containing protein, partial [Candidatus Omnitrophica bacterium]|nr:SEC-C domain-containing protein [Candidatus Omnitrophota bacterium]
TQWKDHLHAMDHIKDGISLRALGQRDPLVEYKKEGFAMFKTLYGAINHEVASLMFKLEPPQGQEDRPRTVLSRLPQHTVHQDFSGLAAAAPQTGLPDGAKAPARSSQVSAGPVLVPVRTEHKVGRNDPCPCGSGKKYKKCCGQ